MTASPTPPRLAVVVSRFNPEVTDGLLAGTRRELAERGVPLAEADIFAAPGAFEMPLLAKALAETGRYAGVVCLGCVIKGDTAHFEFISLGADVVDQYYDSLSVDKVNARFLSWLADNCADYGFVIRYPSDKVSITGRNEPWHVRYVGETAAKFMTEHNLCLEEFVALYQ